MFTIPLPNLGLGFTGGTTRGENYGDAGAPIHLGGLNFGSQSGMGFSGPIPTILLLGVAAIAIYYVARKVK